MRADLRPAWEQLQMFPEKIDERHRPSRASSLAAEHGADWQRGGLVIVEHAAHDALLDVCCK